MKHRILLFSNDIIRQEFEVSGDIFSRITNMLERRNVLTTECFFGNNSPRGIAIFTDNPEQISQRITELQRA